MQAAKTRGEFGVARVFDGIYVIDKYAANVSELDLKIDYDFPGPIDAYAKQNHADIHCIQSILNAA